MNKKKLLIKILLNNNKITNSIFLLLGKSKEKNKKNTITISYEILIGFPHISYYDFLLGYNRFSYYDFYLIGGENNGKRKTT